MYKVFVGNICFNFRKLSDADYFARKNGKVVFGIAKRENEKEFTMKKLSLIDMDAEGLVYVDFSRVTASRSRNGIGYFIYRLEKPLSESEQAILIAHYNNIAFGEAVLRYAPQIKYQTLLVFDKKIK